MTGMAKQEQIMYNYGIGYGSCEDSVYHQLRHEDQYTDEQLADIVAEAVVAVIGMGKESRRELHCYGRLHSYGSIEYAVSEWLVLHKGFARLEIEATWSCDGWGSLFIPDDWGKPDEGSSLFKLAKKVHAAGYTEADDEHERWVQGGYK